MEMIGRRVTLGRQRTLAARWRSSPTALNVAQTVNSPPTQPQSQHLDSGHNFSAIFPQLHFFRACDSRNLNLSPFCTLTASSLVKWQPALNSTYGNITNTYTSGLPGPKRPLYPTSKLQENELLSSLTLVMFSVMINVSNMNLCL